MNKRLTLHLDEQLIKRAKIYAKDNNVSLSKLIEAYLQSLLEEEQNDTEITPLVEQLSGVIDLPIDFDYKRDYIGYLLKKHQ